MNTFVHTDNNLTAVYRKNEVMDDSKKVIQAENDFIFFIKGEESKELKITTEGTIHVYPAKSNRLNEIDRTAIKYPSSTKINKPRHPLKGTEWVKVDMWSGDWITVRYLPDSDEEYLELVGMITMDLEIDIYEYFGVHGLYDDIFSLSKTERGKIIFGDIKLKKRNNTSQFLPGFMFESPKKLSDMLTQDHAYETGYDFINCVATQDFGTAIKKGDKFDHIHMNLKLEQYELYDGEKLTHTIPFKMNIEFTLL